MTFSREKVVFTILKVTFSGEKVTFSGEKVVFSRKRWSFQLTMHNSQFIIKSKRLIVKVWTKIGVISVSSKKIDKKNLRSGKLRRCRSCSGSLYFLEMMPSLVARRNSTT